MKIAALFFCFLFSFSTVSHAGTGFVSNPSERIQGKALCGALAREKLVWFANSLENAAAKLDSFRLIGLDTRAFSLSHYAWFEMDIEINGEPRTLRTLVQFYRIGRRCL